MKNNTDDGGTGLDPGDAGSRRAEERRAPRRRQPELQRVRAAPRRSTRSLSNEAISLRITELVFNGLVGIDEKQEIVPELAERWRRPRTAASTPSHCAAT
jgi:ABC-type transport system substrate-binding protein